jgi:hypothetical protein
LVGACHDAFVSGQAPFQQDRFPPPICAISYSCIVSALGLKDHRVEKQREHRANVISA